MTTITDPKLLRRIHDAITGRSIATAEDIQQALQEAGIKLPQATEPKPLVPQVEVPIEEE